MKPNLPALPFGKLCGSRVAVDGSLVVGAVNKTPTNIVSNLNGTHLPMSWPADRIGWRLETQTNQLGVGLATNWAAVAGSVATNQVTIPLDYTNSSDFIRLVYP